jgi:hypothetical protein
LEEKIGDVRDVPAEDAPRLQPVTVTESAMVGDDPVPASSPLHAVDVVRAVAEA